jgi:hypothetical protein
MPTPTQASHRADAKTAAALVGPLDRAATVAPGHVEARAKAVLDEANKKAKEK